MNRYSFPRGWFRLNQIVTTAARSPFSSTHFDFRDRWHKYETYIKERQWVSISKSDPSRECVEILLKEVEKYNNLERDPFWTRKSNQNVCAVLQVYINGKYEYYFGRNSETHLASGTICSERAAITRALSENPSLHRSHMTRIALIDPDDNHIGRKPCGVCLEYIKKIQEESSKFCYITIPHKINEVKSIYEHYPADYVTEIKNEKEITRMEKLIDDDLQCKFCGESVPQLQTLCGHCGWSEHALKRSCSITFRDPFLTMKIIDAIYKNFHINGNKSFTYEDVINVLGDDEFNRENVIQIIGFIGKPDRYILSKEKKRTRNTKTIWSTKADGFLAYRNALKKYYLSSAIK